MPSSDGRLLEPFPPVYDPEIEQRLLGMLLIENSAYQKVAGVLQEQHFGNGLHARFYAAIGELIERGEPANPVTVRPFFEREPSLANVGSKTYLAQLLDSASLVTISDAPFYARLSGPTWQSPVSPGTSCTSNGRRLNDRPPQAAAPSPRPHRWPPAAGARGKRATNVVGLYSALLRGESGRRGRPQRTSQRRSNDVRDAKATLEQMITDAAKLPLARTPGHRIFEAFPGLTAEELVEKFREAAERDLHEAAELRRYLRQRERAADE